MGEPTFNEQAVAKHERERDDDHKQWMREFVKRHDAQGLAWAQEIAEAQGYTLVKVSEPLFDPETAITNEPLLQAMAEYLHHAYVGNGRPTDDDVRHAGRLRIMVNRSERHSG